MHIVLVHPQIPQNTGSVVRLCAVTGTSLILVPPLGFKVTDRHLKRAGLDYWAGVDVEVVSHWEEQMEQMTAPFYLFSSHATRFYTEVCYTPDSYLIFGSETEGLPPSWYERWSDHLVTLPMLPGKRCLNLANSVSIATYEAWRQQQFAGAHRC